MTLVKVDVWREKQKVRKILLSKEVERDLAGSWRTHDPEERESDGELARLVEV